MNAHCFARRRLLPWIAIGFLSVLSGLRAQDPPTASFDWSMPDRFGSRDPDGKLHYRTARDEVQAPPGGWQVDFTAAASTGDIASFAWGIDGEAVASTDRPAFTWRFPREGAYQITLTVLDRAGISARSIRQVVVQDWLIVALGDSYGSGEGNPDIPIPPEDIADLEEALADLDKKQGEHADALRDLADVEADYDRTRAAAAEVRAKLNAHKAAVEHEKDVCTALPPKPVQCTEAKVETAQALGDLRAALRRMGIEGLIDTVSAIPQEVQRLEDAAQASLAAARAAATAAQAAADAALEKVQRAREKAVPTWQDCPCHRSAYAAQAQAALALEEEDPRTSVTFIHLACSGATVVEGLIGAYEGIEPSCGSGHDDRPQVDQMRDLVADREVDALLVSIGGNDAHFAKIVEACMAEESCHTSAKKDACLAATRGATCERTGPFADRCEVYFSEREPAVPSGKDIFEAGLGGLTPEACSGICDAGPGYEGCRRKECSSLEEKYALLHSYLEDRLPDLQADHIFLAGYPDMTRDDGGNTCAHDPQEPGRSVPCLSREETAWAREEVLARLNAAIADAAAAHGWRSIGPSEDFTVHGYCADEHWIVRLQESFPIQGNVNGALHPNVAGHRANAVEAAAALRADLYPGGDLARPRLPAGAEVPFLRGDANIDGVLDVSDPVTVLGFLFNGSPSRLDCRESADADDNGFLEITDAIRLLGYLFLGDPAPPLPFPGCGKEAGVDGRSCESYGACS